MPKSRSYQAQLVHSLKDPEEAAAYLSAAFEEIDKELFLLALKNVADAQGGLSRLAEISGLNRENLYRMLSDKGNPEFYSLVTLLDALGFQLVVEPKQVAAKSVAIHQAEGKVLSFKPCIARIGSTAHKYALAADTGSKHTEPIVLTSEEGKTLGSLEYDYQEAELYIDLAAPLPDWPSFDVEIRTRDGKQEKITVSRTKVGKFTLLQPTRITKDQVSEVVLRESTNLPRS
jgi:probable addiction module antidote protein